MRHVCFRQKGECLEFIMPSARKKLLTIVQAALLCLFSFPALPDAVYWGYNFTPTTLNASPLTCRQTMECQARYLSCKQGDQILFEVHAFADHLAVSDKGQYIVGLSNRSIYSNRGQELLFWLR